MPQTQAMASTSAAQPQASQQGVNPNANLQVSIYQHPELLGSNFICMALQPHLQ